MYVPSQFHNWLLVLIDQTLLLHYENTNLEEGYQILVWYQGPGSCDPQQDHNQDHIEDLYDEGSCLHQPASQANLQEQNPSLADTMTLLPQLYNRS